MDKDAKLTTVARKNVDTSSIPRVGEQDIAIPSNLNIRTGELVDRAGWRQVTIASAECVVT